MGLIKAAVYGGAGYYAFNKIMKHREQKHQSQSQIPPPQSTKAFEAPSYHYQQQQQQQQPQNNYYGYQYQPQPLEFQAAPEHLRGQHIRIDQNGDSYFSYPQQRLYLDESAPRSTFYHQPAAAKFPPGYVEEGNGPVNFGKK